MTTEMVLKEAETRLKMVPFMPAEQDWTVYGMLQSVAITGDWTRPEDLFQPLQSGFSGAMLTAMGARVNAQALHALTTQEVDIVQVDKFSSRTFQAETAREFGLTAALNGMGLSADQADSENVTFQLAFKNVEKVLLRKNAADEFLRAHMELFCSNDGDMLSHFRNKPTRLAGKKQILLGFVIGTAKASYELEWLESHKKSISFSLGLPSTIGNGLGTLKGMVFGKEKEDSDGVGQVGAQFSVYRLVQSRTGKVTIEDQIYVRSFQDENLKRMYAATLLQKCRGRLFPKPHPENAVSFYIANEGTDNGSADSFRQGMEEARSNVGLRGGTLGIGQFAYDSDGDSSYAELTVEDLEHSTPLFDDQRGFSGEHRASLKWLWYATNAEHSDMWEKLRDGIPVKLEGRRVLSMKPVIALKPDGILPIQYFPKTAAEDLSRVPSYVVRVENGFSITVPVTGVPNSNKRGITMMSDRWRVRESILCILKSDIEEIEHLKAKGFHELHPDEADPEDCQDLKPDSFVVLGRHKLVNLYDLDEEDTPDVTEDEASADGKPSIFRSARPSGADEDRAVSSEVPSAVATGPTASSPNRMAK